MRQLPQWRWHLDAVFVRSQGDTHCLGRAVDPESEVPESCVTNARDKPADLKFLKNATEHYGAPRIVATGPLRLYSAAMREIGNTDRQKAGRHLNNRAENSHQSNNAALLKWRGQLTARRVSNPRCRRRFVFRRMAPDVSVIRYLCSPAKN